MDTTDFLKSKAVNFQAFLLSLKPDESIKSIIESFKPDTVTTTLPMAITAVRLKGIKNTVEEIISHCECRCNKSRDKLQRYLEMFDELA